MIIIVIIIIIITIFIQGAHFTRSHSVMRYSFVSYIALINKIYSFKNFSQRAVEMFKKICPYHTSMKYVKYDTFF